MQVLPYRQVEDVLVPLHPYHLFCLQIIGKFAN